jgi:hypothetical protein
MATTVTSSDTLYKEAGETRNVLVSFRELLDRDNSTNEKLSSITSIAATGLTITSTTVTTVPRIIKGEEIPAGKALQFTVAGGSNGTTYQIKMTVVTSGSQTVVRYVPLVVSAD